MTPPADKIRIGTLQTMIWRNLGDRGNWYSVKLTRDFKADERWRDTDNLWNSGPVLLPATQVARLRSCR